MEPLGNRPLFAGICLWTQVRRGAQPLVGCRWALGCPAPYPPAGRAARGGTHGGCRRVAGTWAAPGSGTPVAVGTVGSPHALAGTAHSAPGMVCPALALMEEVGQSETWTGWDSTLLKQGKEGKNHKIQKVITTIVHKN